ncbi:DUF2254 domain-containing protein [Prosthecobacter sp.]|uniref:DUF2254 domain-containing protein n=1 Tax=Prosthecobacter sp. TaxID=1965333 RepID=UPI0024873825|nr:DUF2254 domain-containing protein [Prosthecobacter sp.]MDI1312063.1 DUF2254 domain-containing protein [Prosthecobacter sp.]
MNRLKRLWCRLRDSFWFVPSLMVALSMVLAISLIELDSSGLKYLLGRWPRVFGASAEGARGILSTIAGSMMTVVGITFSMILVTLTLASSQYTSRILRNFVRNRITQVVLGLFAGIFTYCLVVLRTIRGGDLNEFVPSLSVTVAVLFAIVGIAVLIFFIHHNAPSIQASRIIAAVAEETLNAIERLFPGKLGEGAGSEAEEASRGTVIERKWQAIPAPRNGYIQSIDDSTLLCLAREQKTVVRMECGIGGFVVQGTPLVMIGLDEVPDDDVIAALQNAYGIDRHRTVEQDAGFGIRQLVDMALRALSPGINDTTTAVMCVDYLNTILSRLASREIPSSFRYEDGELRVIAIGPSFEKLVSESFDQIRGSSAGNLAIMLRMLGALHTIGSFTESAARREVLSLHALHLAELAEESLKFQPDRECFDMRYDTFGFTRARTKLSRLSP